MGKFEAVVRYLKEESIFPVFGKSKELDLTALSEIATEISIAAREDFFRSDGSALWVFNGIVYIPITKDDLLGIVRAVMEEKGAPSSYIVLGSQRVADFVWERVMFIHEDWKLEPGLKGFLSFTNGVLEVETGELHRFSSDIGYPTIFLPYDYSPRAQCPKWESIWERLLPNPADRQLLQDVVGWNMLADRDWSWWGLDGKHHGLPKSILEEMYVATGFVPGNSEDGEDIDICFDVATNTGEFNSTWCKEMFREEIQGIFRYCYEGYCNVLARGGKVIPEKSEPKQELIKFDSGREIWIDAPF